MAVIMQKAKEVVFSVIPILVIVLVLNVSFTSLGAELLTRFIIAVIMIIIGLTLFIVGVENGIAPLGTLIGETLTKSNKIWFLVIVALILGFFISLAEPGLFIFAQQIDVFTAGQISTAMLMVVVSLGIAVLFAFALYRIVMNIGIIKVLCVLYFIILIFAIFTEKEMLVIAFDASGTTTGVLAVPFILALTYGVAHLKKDSRSSESDSFGTIAIVSTGVIIAVLLFGLLSSKVSYSTLVEADIPHQKGIFSAFFQTIPKVLFDTAMVVLPLVLIAVTFQLFFIKVKPLVFIRIMKGFGYVFVGLFIFLLGVNVGFMDVGRHIGTILAQDHSMIIIIVVAFVLGVVTVIAEPAVYVLTHQIEDVTSGYVTRNSVLISLGLGVGIAVALSVLRVFIPPLQIWHFLLPGYALALLLMSVTPRMFIGMAYDAGGVATGPMTATFILAFIQGASESALNPHIILDGFGMVAMVALVPIITLQLLGLVFRYKTKKVGVDKHA